VLRSSIETAGVTSQFAALADEPDANPGKPQLLHDSDQEFWIIASLQVFSATCSVLTFLLARIPPFEIP